MLHATVVRLHDQGSIADAEVRTYRCIDPVLPRDGVPSSADRRVVRRRNKCATLLLFVFFRLLCVQPWTSAHCTLSC